LAARGEWAWRIAHDRLSTADEESDEETGKSSFEKRQERLQKTIAELEGTVSIPGVL
jgi:hypothetical protein